MSVKVGVGYKQPPERTRWKKGQSGNPRARKKPFKKGVIETIDSLLRKPLTITIDGSIRKITALEAIVLQLWSKAASGDKQASAVLLRYRQLDMPDDKDRLIRIIGGLPDDFSDLT